MEKIEFMYGVGDLVELARFGMSPENDDHRVYGTVIEVIEPTDYFVPRYRVRIQYDLHEKMEPLAEYHYNGKARFANVMEYDIAGKIERDSQGQGALGTET